MNSVPASIDKMNEMKMFGMARSYKAMQESGGNMDLTLDEVISHLIDSEWDERHNRRLNRLIRAARFRYRASIADLNYSFDRGLDKNLILRLADCSWINRSEDILVTGPTGVGKSFIITALGFQACQYGLSVGYFSSARLFREIKEAKSNGLYLKFLHKVMKNTLVILDDFGLEKLDLTARMALLEIMEDRHGRKPTIIVSQMPVALWHECIGDPTIADAFMDRVAYKSHRIELKGDSIRKKLYHLD